MNFPFPELFQMAKVARENAYAPYSHFLVGACIQTDSGELYAGCNVENASYGMTQCAEATAIGSMVCQGEQKIKTVVVVTDSHKLTPPCGACRQRLSEFSRVDTDVYLCDLKGNYKHYRFADLYPHMFSKSDLL